MGNEQARTGVLPQTPQTPTQARKRTANRHAQNRYTVGDREYMTPTTSNTNIIRSQSPNSHTRKHSANAKTETLTIETLIAERQEKEERKQPKLNINISSNENSSNASPQLMRTKSFIDPKKQQEIEQMKQTNQTDGIFNLGLLISDDDNDDDQNINKFKKITTLKKPKFLYSSKSQGLRVDLLNNAICGQKNVMIIIMTVDNDIFGCFHKETIPYPKDIKIACESTDQFFLFGYNNYKDNPIVRKEGSTDRTIDLHPNNEKQFIFTVFSAFWVNSEGMVWIHQNFKNVYDIPPYCTNPFTCRNVLTPVKVDNLLAVSWQ